MKVRAGHDHFHTVDLEIFARIVSEYDQVIPQSQTADNPWHYEEEPLNHHETPGGQIKQNFSNFVFANSVEIIVATVQKSGKFGHQVNSDTRLQAVEIQMRRLLMGRHIRIFTVCLGNLFFIPII